MGIKTRITEAGLISTNVPGELSSFDCLVSLADEGDLGKFLRTVRTVTPTGNSGDAAAIQAALTAMAGIGEVRLGAGTYSITTAITVPNNSVIVGHPDTVLESTIAATGGQSAAVLGHVATAPNGASDSTTNGAIAVGAISFVATSVAIGASGGNVAIGDTILVGEGNRFFYYEVTNVNVGSKTITVDRPFVSAFASGVTVGVRVCTQNIRIHGNGMTIRGTGDRALNFPSAYRCLIEGVIVEPNDAGSFFGDTPVAYDIGGRFSVFRGLRINNGGGGIHCISLEGCESCVIDDVELRGATAAADYAGLFMAVDYGCKVSNVRANKNSIGVKLQGGGGADIYACRSCELSNIEAQFNTGIGLYVAGGSSYNSFTNVNANNNGSVGVNIVAGVDANENTRSNTFTNITANGNTLGGVSIEASTKDNAFSNVSAIGGGGYAFDISGGDVLLQNLTAQDNASGGVQVAGAASATIIGAKISSTVNGFWAGIVLSTSGVVRVSHVRFGTGGTGTKLCVSHASGTGLLVLEDASVFTGTPTYGYFCNATTTRLRRGPNVDFSTASTPYDFSTAGQRNFGSATLTAGAVTVANTMINATDRIKLTKRTVGGTEGFPRISALTAATSFVITSSSGTDTSTFEWAF